LGADRSRRCSKAGKQTHGKGVEALGADVSTGRQSLSRQSAAHSTGRIIGSVKEAENKETARMSLIYKAQSQTR